MTNPNQPANQVNENGMLFSDNSTFTLTNIEKDWIAIVAKEYGCTESVAMHWVIWANAYGGGLTILEHNPLGPEMYADS